MSDKLLEVKNLHVEFQTEGGVIHAVNGVDLFLKPSEIVGLVGESGCGKSVTAFSFARLLPETARITRGEILLGENDVLHLHRAGLAEIRGKKIAYIFQEPATSLNPIFTIGNQLFESIRTNRLPAGRQEERDLALRALKKVGLPAPEELMNVYPHQLSGGMKQRAMIAMALASGASLLIADEPTTALDVTIQAQILSLLSELKDTGGLTILFITHDISLLSALSDRLYVMYAGRIVEDGPTREVIENPRHPYTQGLLACVPTLEGKKRKFPVIPGELPAGSRLPNGCLFYPRCSYAEEGCAVTEPGMIHITEIHQARCPVINR
ncbi:MAG: ABC transporter ATP-binding protein [Candidatus Omnitrophica bacterium]|nr:ABC transporter ATP-binding protein [Candidatus Omnitrophota bacterium]